MNAVKMDVTKAMCEQATGCRATATLKHFPLWDGEGNKISDSKARKLFRSGKIVEDPNAGAGSYTDFLSRMGFKKVSVLNWSSSAGDWQFKVSTGVVSQENRYPYHGFRYSLDKQG
jgi:hypothetical protein